MENQTPDNNPRSSYDEIVAAVRRITRAVDLQSRGLLHTCGLTGPQVVALHAIANAGAIGVSDLARRVHLSQPTVTGIVERLVRGGLVERTAPERDRRTAPLRATPLGVQVLASGPSVLHADFRRAIGDLADWERSMILATLQRVAQLMEAAARPAPRRARRAVRDDDSTQSGEQPLDAAGSDTSNGGTLHDPVADLSRRPTEEAPDSGGSSAGADAYPRPGRRVVRRPRR